jgi:hypothetical protein
MSLPTCGSRPVVSAFAFPYYRCQQVTLAKHPKSCSPFGVSHARGRMRDIRSDLSHTKKPRLGENRGLGFWSRWHLYC